MKNVPEFPGLTKEIKKYRMFKAELDRQKRKDAKRQHSQDQLISQRYYIEHSYPKNLSYRDPRRQFKDTLNPVELAYFKMKEAPEGFVVPSGVSMLTLPEKF